MPHKMWNFGSSARLFASVVSAGYTDFNGLTLLAYLNYTPRLRYTHEDQIHYSRTRSVAGPRVPSRMPTVQADGVAILPHGAMPPATLYIWGLGPGSRKSNFSPRPRRNSNFIAVASSTQRVLQLWSNRTWSTWLLFWSRKWPSEASNHHFPPLRSLGIQGCALWGASKSSLTWGAARQKRRFLRETG